jgi:hypothetical protein
MADLHLIGNVAIEAQKAARQFGVVVSHAVARKLVANGFIKRWSSEISSGVSLQQDVFFVFEFISVFDETFSLILIMHSIFVMNVSINVNRS